MTWLLASYLIGLLYFAAQPEKISNKGTFRTAWIWFALIPVSNFVFALFRAGNISSTRDLALVEIWADGFGWLFLGISFFVLIGALVPDVSIGAEHAAPSDGDKPTD
jgi:hypothetical protein